MTLLKATFVLLLSFSAAGAGANSYVYRQPVSGLSPAATPATPAPPPASPTGDGVSQAGACASGAASGCISWDSTGVSPLITVSGTPPLDLSISNCNGSNACTVRGTKSYTTGKWYWEVTFTAVTSGFGGVLVGLSQPTGRLNDNTSIYFYTNDTGRAYNGNTSLALTNQGLTAVGDVLGFALDMDARTLAVTRNGKPLFNTTVPAGLTSVTPAAGDEWYLSHSLRANFGQSSFANPVPAGYNAGLW